MVSFLGDPAWSQELNSAIPIGPFQLRMFGNFIFLWLNCSRPTMSQPNRHLHVDSNQKVLSLLISSEYLCSTGSCQGDESCTSQEENMLPHPKDFMKLKHMHFQSLKKNTSVYWPPSSEPRQQQYLSMFHCKHLIFVNISVTCELQLIHQMRSY